MADVSSLMEWTFYDEVAVPENIKEILIEGEIPEVAYKTIRDIAVITNKRFIIADRQGITGKKIEIYTIPFKSIDMYSTENGGRLDTNAEIEIIYKVRDI